jgi:hypothetical protein
MKKFLAIITSLVLTVGICAGCTEKETSEGNTGTTPAGQTTTKAPEENVTLTVWSIATESDAFRLLFQQMSFLTCSSHGQADFHSHL